MREHAGRDFDLVLWDLPRLGGGRDETGPSLSRNLAIPKPESARRRRRASDLEPAAKWIPVNVSGRRSSVSGVDNLDRIEVGIELLRDDGRQAGMNALPHFNLA